MLPILIASKGRPDGKTMQVLADEGLPYTAVVEPQDADEYRRHGRTIAMLDANDQGLAYVRQWVLSECRDRGFAWYWMLDDDITGFFEVRRGRCHRVTARAALEGAERYFLHEKHIGLAGLEYRQFAWASQSDFRLDSYTDVCVAIRTDTMADYDPGFKLKVDRDYTLQVLQEGFRVMKVCRFAFSAAKNGSNKGGLHDTYASGIEREMSLRLSRKWPGIAHPYTKKDGRPDVKVDWTYFQKKRAS